MTVYYLDTSALVKRYAHEQGSIWTGTLLAVTERAMDLAAAHGLRGYDAVHLGAALDIQDVRRTMALPDLTFVSADTNQRQAAAAEGLLVEDPNAYS